MRIKKFATHTIQLLNNLRRTWKIIIFIENIILIILKKFNPNKLIKALAMEQDDEQQQQQQQQQPERGDGQQIEVAEANQNNRPEPMDVYADEQENPGQDEDSDDDAFDDGDDEEDQDQDEDETDDEQDVSTDVTTDSDSDMNGETYYYRRKLTSHIRYTMYKELQLSMLSSYTFQPLKLIKVNYKFLAPGVDFPVSRSGHRVIASESHLYSLGGYNPRSALSAARRGLCLLFQELWSYNFSTNKWKLLLNGENAQSMPRELASNALAIHNNVLIVSICQNILLNNL